MRTAKIFFLILAILLGFMICSSGQRGKVGGVPVHVIKGPLDVTYNRLALEGGAPPAILKGVESVRIYADFVLITKDAKSGEIVPISQLRNLNWQK